MNKVTTLRSCHVRSPDKGRPQAFHLLFAVLFAAAVLATIHVCFDPRWETNDDVGMAMVAHGYGSGAYGSPNLVYSNVIWGFIVQSIPTAGGINGYSLATMAVLLASSSAVLFFLLSMQVGYAVGCLALTLILVRPVLFPQFTINAGLLTVAAIAGLHVYARSHSVCTLIVASLLAFFAYLIRDQIFFLLLAIAGPMLPWRVIASDRRVIVAIALLGCTIVTAQMYNTGFYSGPEWQQFRELHAARVPYTDYKAGHYLIRDHLDIAHRHGYSKNDLQLVGNWFFVDPKIADPAKLEAMTKEMGPISLQNNSIDLGISAIRALASEQLLPIAICSLALLIILPRFPTIITCFLFLVAVFSMGLMGRPGILRVYFPMVSLILVSCVLFASEATKRRQMFAALFLTGACLFNLAHLIPEARVSSQNIQQVRREIASLPKDLLIVWGARFPFEFAFPGFMAETQSHQLEFYSLGSLTLAPFSVAAREERAGRGLLDRLRSPEGATIVARETHLELLRTYCQEHLKAQFYGEVLHQGQFMTVYKARCSPG